MCVTIEHIEHLNENVKVVFNLLGMVIECHRLNSSLRFDLQSRE